MPFMHQYRIVQDPRKVCLKLGIQTAAVASRLAEASNVSLNLVVSWCWQR